MSKKAYRDHEEDAVAVEYVVMGRMFNPPHPGETIREDVLPALGLSVTEAAEQLGVSRVSFSRVINGKAAISPIMARRLEAWLNGPEHGPSAELWLRGQLAYDLWQAEQAPAPRVQAVSDRGPDRRAVILHCRLIGSRRTAIN